MLQHLPLKFALAVAALIGLPSFYGYRAMDASYCSAFIGALNSVVLVAVAINAFGLWRWIWKINERFFNAHVFPDIQGTYTGTLNFVWEGTHTKPMTLVIRQSLTKVRVFLKTDVSQSDSVTAEIIKDGHDAWRLYYGYDNTSRNPTVVRSGDHSGFAQLNILASNPLALSGRYFTDRNTSGSLELSRVGRSTEINRAYTVA